YEHDTNAVYTVDGANWGVGSRISWIGNDKVGVGSNEIIESENNSYIKTKLFFGKSEHPAYATITLDPKDNGTKVSWVFENDFGYNIFYRYFGLVLEDMIAPDYEKGLQNLKRYVESLPIYDYSNISMVETRAERVYTYAAQTNVQPAEITAAITVAYGKIMDFINTNNIGINGTPKIINKSLSADVYQFLAAIPVEDNSLPDETGMVRSGSTYEGKAVRLVHTGSYNNFQQSYDVLAAYIQQNNLTHNGNSWEDFITDPATVNEENLITYIFQPIKKALIKP
ncbi:hypothetical protein MNBD_GAMMA03-1247, partial [hydrothermal vent metagenome]